jgi:hypothetical protein
VTHDRSRLSLSILGAGALVGAGLYFGLSARPATDASPSASGSAAPRPTLEATGPAPGADTSTGPTSPTSPTPAPTAEPSALAAAEAEALATKAIEAFRKDTYVEQCWKPALAKSPSPATSKHVLDITFGPEGTPISYGFSDVRGETREELTSCLSRVTVGLKLPKPPGRNVRVQPTLTFP